MNLLNLAPRDNDKSNIFIFQFDGCDRMPCEAFTGETSTGWLNFEAENVLAETMSCRLYAIIGGLELIFPGGCPEPRACKEMINPEDVPGFEDLQGLPGEGECPVYPGESFLYNLSLPILDTYPKTNIIGQFTLWNDVEEGQEEELIMCVEIDVVIKDRTDP